MTGDENGAIPDFRTALPDTEEDDELQRVFEVMRYGGENCKALKKFIDLTWHDSVFGVRKNGRGAQNKDVPDADIVRDYDQEAMDRCSIHHPDRPYRNKMMAASLTGGKLWDKLKAVLQEEEGEDDQPA